MATNSKPTAIKNKVIGQKHPSKKISGFSFFSHNAFMHEQHASSEAYYRSICIIRSNTSTVTDSNY
jgi:hypothetical protein